MHSTYTLEACTLTCQGMWCLPLTWTVCWCYLLAVGSRTLWGQLLTGWWQSTSRQQNSCRTSLQSRSGTTFKLVRLMTLKAESACVWSAGCRMKRSSWRVTRPSFIKSLPRLPTSVDLLARLWLFQYLVSKQMQLVVCRHRLGVNVWILTVYKFIF